MRERSRGAHFFFSTPDFAPPAHQRTALCGVAKKVNVSSTPCQHGLVVHELLYGFDAKNGVWNCPGFKPARGSMAFSQ